MKVITEESFKRSEVLVPPDALLRVLKESFHLRQIADKLEELNGK